ncbi:MAG: hypothetical protein JWM81_274 [Candidatus Saccharibacteria bacterium]|nr:hypothetical protein [Candidatus Saccharibacteria bacterium]
MKTILPKILRPKQGTNQAAYRQLISDEAKIGGKLFGPVPAGHRREFFCLDEHTWVWHEEWTENGHQRSITTRYDVRPNGVLKSQAGQPYTMIGFEEAVNLYQAVDLYDKQVNQYYDYRLKTA